MKPGKRIARRFLQSIGYELVRSEHSGWGPENQETIEFVAPYTMTSPQRVSAVVDAVTYVVKNQVSGAFVECGVWAGGSAMAAARTFAAQGDTGRELYLYDTFEGMSEPTALDKNARGEQAAALLSQKGNRESVLCYASLKDVRDNMAKVDYPRDRVHFIQGKVEDTIPGDAPDQIALLRLDTDWYESTRHELTHLIPRLAPYGVVIIDDYGHWMGARRAVDEWLAEFQRPVLLNRIDYSGRMAIIPPA